MYDSKHSFSDYKNVRKYYNLPFMKKHDELNSFYHRLNEFRNLIPSTEKPKMKKKSVFKNASNLYNALLTIYFNGSNTIMDTKKSRWIKSMILVIYFLRFIQKNCTKKTRKLITARKNYS